MKKLLIILLIFALLLTACGRADDIDQVTSDPGPPIVWHFYSMEEFYEMERNIGLGVGELTDYLDENGFHLSGGAMGPRETAEKVSSMVRSTWIPGVEGLKLVFMDIQPEEGRESVFYRLEGGDCAVNVLYQFEDDIEKKWLESLGGSEHEPIVNESIKEIYLTERDVNVKNEAIYRFGCNVEGKYVQVFVFRVTEDGAREVAERITFTKAEELKG